MFYEILKFDHFWSESPAKFCLSSKTLNYCYMWVVSLYNLQIWILRYFVMFFDTLIMSIPQKLIILRFCEVGVWKKVFLSFWASYEKCFIKIGRNWKKNWKFKKNSNFQTDLKKFLEVLEWRLPYVNCSKTSPESISKHWRCVKKS